MWRFIKSIVNTLSHNIKTSDRWHWSWSNVLVEAWLQTSQPRLAGMTLWHFEASWTPWPLRPPPQTVPGAVFRVWQQPLSRSGTSTIKLCRYLGGGVDWCCVMGWSGCFWRGFMYPHLQPFDIKLNLQPYKKCWSVTPTLTNLLSLPYMSINCIPALQYKDPYFEKKKESVYVISLLKQPQNEPNTETCWKEILFYCSDQPWTDEPHFCRRQRAFCLRQAIPVDHEWDRMLQRMRTSFFLYVSSFAGDDLVLCLSLFDRCSKKCVVVEKKAEISWFLRTRFLIHADSYK